MVGGLFGVVLAVVAVLYVLAARAVLRQARVGHILAIVLCVLGMVLGVTPSMSWLDWTVLAANLVAAGALLGCVPRRPADRRDGS